MRGTTHVGMLTATAPASGSNWETSHFASAQPRENEMSYQMVLVVGLGNDKNKVFIHSSDLRAVSATLTLVFPRGLSTEQSCPSLKLQSSIPVITTTIIIKEPTTYVHTESLSLPPSPCLYL